MIRVFYSPFRFLLFSILCFLASLNLSFAKGNKIEESIATVQKETKALKTKLLEDLSNKALVEESFKSEETLLGTSWFETNPDLIQKSISTNNKNKIEKIDDAIKANMKEIDSFDEVEKQIKSTEDSNSNELKSQNVNSVPEENVNFDDIINSSEFTKSSKAKNENNQAPSTSIPDPSNTQEQNKETDVFKQADPIIKNSKDSTSGDDVDFDIDNSTNPKNTPAETTPAETTHAETMPVEPTPTETAPAETTPAETAPAETTPAETTPAAPLETSDDDTESENMPQDDSLKSGSSEEGSQVVKTPTPTQATTSVPATSTPASSDVPAKKPTKDETKDKSAPKAFNTKPAFIIETAPKKDESTQKDLGELDLMKDKMFQDSLDYMCSDDYKLNYAFNSNVLKYETMRVDDLTYEFLNTFEIYYDIPKMVDNIKFITKYYEGKDSMPNF
jgi:hypothetical protein